MRDVKLRVKADARVEHTSNHSNAWVTASCSTFIAVGLLEPLQDKAIIFGTPAAMRLNTFLKQARWWG